MSRGSPLLQTIIAAHSAKVFNSVIAEHETDLQAGTWDNLSTRGKVSILHSYSGSTVAFADHKWDKHHSTYDCTHYYVDSSIMEYRANLFLSKYVEIMDPDFASNSGLCNC